MTLTINQIPSHSHYENIEYGDNDVRPWATKTGGSDWGKYFNPSLQDNSTKGKPVTTMTTGGSQAHNNLQPYITCYMWKRTA